MTQKISNCGHDENNKYSGGSAGDQTGTEWYIRSWYSYPWNYALYHPDSKVNDLVAQLAKEAAENDRIGYDQNERLTFWQELKSAGYYPKSITTKCEADCSSGVAAIVKAAGYILGDTSLQGVAQSAYTGNLKTYLVKAGYKAYTTHLTNSEYYPKGTIWLNTSHHTTIQTTMGSKYSGSSSSSSSGSSSGYTATLTIDGYWGSKTSKRLQTVLGTTVDGVISSQDSDVKKQVAGNVSDWEFTSNAKAKGSECIKAMQKKLSVSRDGLCGKNTIKALQKRYGTTQDGCFSAPSDVVKALQKKLNGGSF